MEELTWWQAKPALLDDIRAALTGHYASLMLSVTPEGVTVRGSFPVVHLDEVLDRYEVEINFPDDYPDDPPSLRETGGRIPRVPERHNSSGVACLFVPIDWKAKRTDLAFRTFLDEPVKQYFAKQSLVEEGQPWPSGERAHGVPGALEALRELIGVDTDEAALRALALLAEPTIKGHWPCVCGSAKRLRDCHGPALRKLQSPTNLQWARKMIVAHIQDLCRERDLAVAAIDEMRPRSTAA
ncbi:MAG: hypothetical protein WAU68_00875 [Vitreimonas sp.]